MTQDRTYLFIGTPCFGGQVSSLYTTSLMRLQHACALKGGIDIGVNLLSGDALITRARQDIVAHFLEMPQATHLMFIDGDIAFDPSQVFRLLEFGADVAAGVYPTKKIDWGKVGALAKAGMANLESVALSYVSEFEDPQKITARDGFAKARYAGTGFMMIRREALLKMAGHYPELRYTGEHLAEDPLKNSKWRYAFFNCMVEESTGIFLSEDFSFCRRWTGMGGEIWVDLQSRLAHTGTMTFYGNAATQFGQPANT